MAIGIEAIKILVFSFLVLVISGCGASAGKKQKHYSLEDLKSNVCDKSNFSPAETTITRNGKEHRTLKGISEIFDCNKGVVYGLYRQAHYIGDKLEGKIVLEITISAEGSVSKVQMVSTGLDNEEFENNLVKLVKMFNFPSASVEPLVVTYPLDFVAN